MKAPPSPLLFTAALLFLQQGHVIVSAVTYNVSPFVEDSSSSDDATSTGIFTVADAFAVAQAGDTIVLADGTYTKSLDRIASVIDGEKGNPITVTGSRDAVIKVPSPSVRIENSWITIEGFSVDGEHGDTYEEDSFVNKCVDVIGQGNSEDEALEGFVMQDMHVKNCGGECVRLKNFVINADINGNTIQDCGLYDYAFGGPEKNGEGVYIGTSTSQWDGGEDRCNNNWVRGNTIETCGNECVEIKEGSSGNLVENNVCSNQLDPNAGCYAARGDDNTIRYNTATNCQGAGIRVGGNEEDGYTYGKNNNVYGNDITEADAAALSIRSMPQGVFCGNTCSGDNCILDWEEEIGDIEETWNESCPEIDDDFVFPTTNDDSEDDVTPTLSPTMAPTPDPTPEPTVDSTVSHTVVPTVSPTVEPTPEPTVDSTVSHTVVPTVSPTVDPRESESQEEYSEVERPDDDGSENGSDDDDRVGDDNGIDDDDDGAHSDDYEDDDDTDDDTDDSTDDYQSDDNSGDDDDSNGDDYQSDDDNGDDDDSNGDDYQSDDDSGDDDDSNGDDYQSDDDSGDDYQSDDDSGDDDDSNGDDYQSDDDSGDDDDSNVDDYQSDDDSGDDYQSDDDSGDDYQSDDDSGDDDDSNGDDYQSDDDSGDDEGDDDSKENRDDDGDDYQ